MIIQKEIDTNKPESLSKRQLDMLKALESRKISFDEDNPELTDEELAEFRRVSEIRRDERKKQTVTLRLSSSALKKAKSLGKGYTSVLARILEQALSDNEMIKRYL